jgi:two-component system, OmpR family, sensor histidine kinase QseC
VKGLAAPAAYRRLRSLQARLLVSVLGLVSLVWLAVVVSTWWDTEHEVGELLDAHMSQAASLLVSLPLDELTQLSLSETPTLHEYQPKVVFQVLHLQDQVVRSSTAPAQPLAAPGVLGFSQSVIDGQSWRVFSTPGLDEHVVIHVGEQDEARADVIWASLRSVVWPMTVALPVLALLVWGAVGWAVKPLRDLGWQVAHRKPEVADPLPLTDVPLEAQPLVQELNRLFDRTASLIQAERRFTADAAHELRTPIAAIRMQAQVAQGARDDHERNDALTATLQGCDRATRLVVQLLQLARLEAEPGAAAVTTRTDIHACLRQVMADLTAVAQRRHQRLEALPLDGEPCLCPVPEALVAVLLRNLLDNALRYSPDHARVRVKTQVWDTGGVRLTVEDSGPGLAPEHLARLGERFFRVVGTEQSGSGLGWSIVTRVATLYGLTLHLGRSDELGGLRVDVEWG